MKDLQVKAWNLATKAHMGQSYGNMPYTSHLQQVMECSRLAAKAQDMSKEEVDQVAAVAILHDVLEDTDTTFEYLAHQFPYEVVRAVELLTKKSDYNREVYLRNIRGNELALLVKKEDTMCNLVQSHKESNLKRVKKYTKQLSDLYGD